MRCFWKTGRQSFLGNSLETPGPVIALTVFFLMCIHTQPGAEPTWKSLTMTVFSFPQPWAEARGSLSIISLVKVLVTQSCPTLCDPMNCTLPGSSIHEILQTRILEWVAIPFSRGSSQHRDQTQVFYFAGRFFLRGSLWAIREALCSSVYILIPNPCFILHLATLVTVSLYSMSVHLFLFCQ